MVPFELDPLKAELYIHWGNDTQLYIQCQYFIGRMPFETFLDAGTTKLVLKQSTVPKAANLNPKRFFDNMLIRWLLAFLLRIAAGF